MHILRNTNLNEDNKILQIGHTNTIACKLSSHGYNIYYLNNVGYILTKHKNVRYNINRCMFDLAFTVDDTTNLNIEWIYKRCKYFVVYTQQYNPKNIFYKNMLSIGYTLNDIHDTFYMKKTKTYVFKK